MNASSTDTTTAPDDRLAELREHPNYKRIAGMHAPNEYHEKDENSADEGEEFSCSSCFSSPPNVRPKLADAALYGPAGEIIRRLAPHTEADPAAMYAQLLTGLGSLIGPGAWFVADGAVHHANLFTVVAGRTAKARKGTSWARVKGVLSDLDDVWFSTRIKSGVVSGEGIVEAFRDDEQGEKRLLLVESEFAQVLQCLKREGNTVSVLLRNAWDGARISVMRRRDPIEVEGAHVSMIGHVTLPELNRLLAGVDISNGLANRCLWVFADREQLLPEGGGTPDLDEPLNQLYSAVQAASGRGQVRRDVATRELWAGIYQELSVEPHGTLGELTSRGEAQVMRLALLMALLDRAGAIECRHLEAAMAFWRYCEASAAFIFADHLVSRRAKRILNALHCGALSMSQIHKIFGNNVSKAEIDQALAELQGKIRIKSGGPGGGVTVRLVGG